MAGRAAVQAVLFDALGTLVRLEPPAPRLRAELARTTGVDVGDAAAERGNTARVAAASTLGLGLFTAQYATWYFIA